MDLEQFAKILHNQSAHKLVIADAIRAAGGRLVLGNTEPVLDTDGAP